MLDPSTAAIAANRFGLGARPGELGAIGADPRAWLRAQLQGTPPELAATELRPSADTLAAALELRREKQAEKKAARAASPAADGAAAQLQEQNIGQLLRPVYASEAG